MRRLLLKRQAPKRTHQRLTRRTNEDFLSTPTPPPPPTSLIQLAAAMFHWSPAPSHLSCLVLIAGGNGGANLPMCLPPVTGNSSWFPRQQQRRIRDADAYSQLQHPQRFSAFTFWLSSAKKLKKLCSLTSFSVCRSSMKSQLHCQHPLSRWFSYVSQHVWLFSLTADPAAFCFSHQLFPLTPFYLTLSFVWRKAWILRWKTPAQFLVVKRLVTFSFVRAPCCENRFVWSLVVQVLDKINVTYVSTICWCGVRVYWMQQRAPEPCQPITVQCLKYMPVFCTEACLPHYVVLLQNFQLCCHTCGTI